MATYLATRDGHLGKQPVKVIRGKKEIHEAHILAGDIFEWDGPKGSWMEEYDGSAIAEPEVVELPRTMSELQEQLVQELPEEITGEKTKNQIIAELRAKGIPFKVADRKEVLLNLLNAEA